MFLRLLRINGSRQSGPVWPSADAQAVSGAVREDPAARGVGAVDDAASCGKGRRHTRLDLLASDGHVDVHRVPERLVRVELLHPDRRAVAERIDGIVVVYRRVPEGGAPEADLDRVGLGSYRYLNLLRTCAVGEG